MVMVSRTSRGKTGRPSYEISARTIDDEDSDMIASILQRRQECIDQGVLLAHCRWRVSLTTLGPEDLRTDISWS